MIYRHVKAFNNIYIYIQYTVCFFGSILEENIFSFNSLSVFWGYGWFRKVRRETCEWWLKRSTLRQRHILKSKKMIKNSKKMEVWKKFAIIVLQHFDVVCRRLKKHFSDTKPLQTLISSPSAETQRNWVNWFPHKRFIAPPLPRLSLPLSITN